MSAENMIGYARVSSNDQNLERQLEALKVLGIIRIYTDKTSGKNTDRPGFLQMMDYVREGDHVYVCSMDRLARSLKDLLEVNERFQKKGVAIHYLKENITIDPNGNLSPISKLLLSMMGAVAEFERALIRERQAEGIALAKKRGVYKGRAPIDAEIIAKVKEKIALGIPITKVAKELGIGRTTIYKYLSSSDELTGTTPNK